MPLSGIQLSAGIVVGSNTSVDAKFGPYADVATAKSEIGSTLRYKGLTVGILVGGSVVEYWWKDGITDSDLVVKGGATAWGTITGTLSSQTDLQSALDGKQATITGAATTIDTEDLTASRAIVSDGSGKVAVSSVTSTELGYLSGVTSAVQTQVDSKTTKLITTNRQTASYTLVLSDADKLVEMNVGSANNLTVPLNSSVAFPTGTQILLAQYGAGQTTIVATSGVTVRSNGGKLKLNVQYSGATLIKIGTDEWYLFGDIVS
jgi:hypothetical protein